MNTNELLALEQLRDRWGDIIAHDGGYCPCCDRWGKINSHGIHKSLALCLRWLYEYTKRSKKDWIHVVEEAPRQVLRTRSFAGLEYWGLIRRQFKVESEVDTSYGDKKSKKQLGKTRSSGLWQITPLGIDFVEGKTLMPKRVFVYNKIVQGKTVATVSFEDCLGELYHYGASMSINYADEELA
jgi:hypothetical protein